MLIVPVPRAELDTRRIFIPGITGSSLEVSWETVKRMGLETEFEYALAEEFSGLHKRETFGEVVDPKELEG